MLQSADPRCYAVSLQISKPVIIPILFLVAAAEALSLFFFTSYYDNDFSLSCFISSPFTLG